MAFEHLTGRRIRRFPATVKTDLGIVGKQVTKYSRISERRILLKLKPVRWNLTLGFSAGSRLRPRLPDAIISALHVVALSISNLPDKFNPVQ
jgi:hypothetical protein